MSSSDIINDTITPFVQRILSDPLHFKPAKNPEIVTHSTLSYIKVGTAKNKDTAGMQSKDRDTDSNENSAKAKSFIPKITSLAQALAGYTNKRKVEDSGSMKNTKKTKREETPSTSESDEDDIGENLDLDNGDISDEEDLQPVSSAEDDDSNYQDAKSTDLKDAESLKTLESFESSTSNIDTNENDEEDDDDDDDDDDFTADAAESKQETDDESPTLEDSDEEDDRDYNDTNQDSPSESDSEEDLGEELEATTEADSKSADEDSDEIQLLKKELLDDQRDPLTTSLTPPTSPDSEDDKEPTPQPQITSKLDNFYQLNENQNDRGSNGSKRIVKNWGPTLLKLKPLGLLNHGVTCYTNAAVQAMIHIPAVQHYLFDILKNKYKDTISPSSVSHTLAETSARMWNYDKSSKKVKFINPKKLIGRLDDINCMMSEWQQEDSHEYFMSLLSRLQEDSTPKGHKLNESTIYDIFGGLLNQSVTCKSCGHVSKTNQEFYDLSLHLGNSRKNSQTGDGNSLPQEEETVKQRYSIQKSINDFFSPELIKTDKSDKSGYVCENCKKRTNAIKISSIDRAPETLLVHLKRFRFNGSSSSKVKQGVSYPSMLDLSQYTTNDDNVLYELISVVVHEGRSVSSGHYIAHCRQPDGTWATHDDEYINAITEKQALRDPSAYYLVYTRLTSKEHKLATDTSKSMEPTLSPVRAKAPMNSTTKPLKSFVATPKSKISVNSPKVKKRLGIIGHQPTNNLNNIGNKTLKKKYSQKSKKIGSKRLRKY